MDIDKRFRLTGRVMLKRDNYFFELGIVCGLFFLFLIMTYKDGSFVRGAGVESYSYEQLYIYDSSDDVNYDEEIQDIYNAFFRRGSSISEKTGYRNKGITVLFAITFILGLFKKIFFFYFRTIKNKDLLKYNISKAAVRRGPPANYIFVD